MSEPSIPEPVLAVFTALVALIPSAINAFNDDARKMITERLDGAAARLPAPGSIDAATQALIARHRARVSPQVTQATADVLMRLSQSIRATEEEQHALRQAVGLVDLITTPSVDEKGS